MAGTRHNSVFIMLPLIITIVIVNLFVLCDALTYSPTEKQAIDQLRNVMGDQLYRDYMTSDDYLITWLRARNMNVPRAKDMLQNSLTYRKQNKIDTILEEDFTTYEKQFKFAFDGFDKDGRNLVIAHYGSWDVRQAIIAGEGKRVNRYLDRAFELAATIVRERNETNPYHNNTQVILIIDLAGYNLRQHACAGCIPSYLHFVNTYESNWPLLGHKIFLVNTPEIFKAMLAILRPLMSPATRRDLTVLGLDKSEWQTLLLNNIEPDQLSKRLGGTREDATFKTVNHLKRASSV